MKKRQRLELTELVQEIEMVIDDWHCTKCPHNGSQPIHRECNGCPHYKLCKCLLELSQIKYRMYNSNGELRK